MIELVRRLADDSYALTKACGPRVTARWLFEIVRNLPACVRAHNLAPADFAIGEGPFEARLGPARARLVGPWVMGGIREIWARNVYLSGGFLAIQNGDVVVDLGTNAGNFTALALGHGPDVRAVCVEANPTFADRLHKNLELNGWTGRARLLNVFLGGMTATQEDMRSRPELGGIPTWSEAEFLRETGLTRIDFLKCDIEGSEFELFGKESRLLAMSRQLALEVHKAAGSARDMTELVRSHGFDVRIVSEDDAGLILLAKRVTAA
jgi:FkbM family methyltransferase